MGLFTKRKRVPRPGFDAQTFDDHANEAIERLITIINGSRAAIINHARERASSVGVAEYGSTSYDKTNSQLGIEVLDELADAVFYEHIVASRMNN